MVRLVDGLSKHFARMTGFPYDILAAQHLSRLDVGFSPWTESSMRPAALMAVLSDVIINRRNTVVELGTGVSTILLCKVLKLTGGKLLSVEHDASWAAVVAEMLRREGLQDVCELVVSPLVRCEYALGGQSWYELDAIKKQLGQRCINLLLVDGPTAASPGKRLVRYPALPSLADCLSPQASVFLDDVHRQGELSILRRWERVWDIEFRKSIIRGSFAVGFKGEHFNIL